MTNENASAQLAELVNKHSDKIKTFEKVSLLIFLLVLYYYY
jgi:hypothetical protein